MKKKDSHRQFWKAIISVNFIVAVYALMTVKLAATGEQQFVAVLVVIGAVFLLMIIDAIAFAIVYAL